MWIFDNPSVQAALLRIASIWPAKYNAPYVPTPMPIVRQMLELAKVGPGDLVYDPGCGDGRTVIAAAYEYGARAVGIELDLLRFLWCQILITFLGLRGDVKIILGNFLKEDLSKADVVTCYLGKETNQVMQEKFKKELRPNTRIVSYNLIFTELNFIKEEAEDRVYLYSLQNQ